MTSLADAARWLDERIAPFVAEHGVPGASVVPVGDGQSDAPPTAAPTWAPARSNPPAGSMLHFGARATPKKA